MSISATGSHQFVGNSDGATQSMTNINTCKKGRGKGKLNWPKDRLKKEALEFDKHGVGVGEGASRFSRYLGILARDSNQIPLSYLRWDKVPQEKKNLLWEMIRVEMEQNLETLVTVEGHDTLELRQRAYVQAMGPETRNRVRGEGLGVTPHQIPWVQISPTTSSRRSRSQSYIQLQSEYMDVQKVYQNRITELEEENQHIRRQMEEQQQSTQQQLDALSEKMNIMHSQHFQQPQSQEAPSRPLPSHRQHIQSSKMPYYPSPIYPTPGYPPMFYQPPVIYPQATTNGFTALLTGDGRQSDHEAELMHSTHSSEGHN